MYVIFTVIFVDDDGRNHSLFNLAVDVYERVYSIVITNLDLFLNF